MMVDEAMRLRKKQFRVALAVAETTQTELAASFGVSAEHLSRVLNHKVTSAPLLQKVDSFIAKHCPEVAA